MKESLEVIIIENSANCNLRCEACPTVYAKNYPRNFMSLDTLKSICDNITPDIFPKCGLLGWGEPFYDPGYFEKLRYLKELGYFVGSTSNLSLLDKKMMTNILDSGLDYLNISVDAMHFDASGTPLSKMIKSINMLFNLHSMRRSPLNVGVVIVVFKTSRYLISNIVQALEDYPFVSIDFVPLFMIPSQHLYNELMTRNDFEVLKGRLAKEFRTLPLSFDFTLNEDKIAENCRSNIFKTIYVNYRGYVSPCSMMAMEFPNITFSGELGYTRLLNFGRLDQQRFEDIWESENFVSFRNKFKANKLPQQCMDCNCWRPLP